MQLQLQNLRFHNLGPIDLTIHSNERLMISGPSGAGKTLLLRAIADLDPHTGEVYLNNKSSLSFTPTEWRKTIGFLPAENVWWYETVSAHFTTIEPEWFAKLSLDISILKRNINGLSTGERQRLALLRLLANHPSVLLLDEVTANLDQENTLCIEALIRLYQQRQQAIVIWISHNQEQIHRVATKHCNFKDGLLKEINL